jgi:hypothetical protein
VADALAQVVIRREGGYWRDRLRRYKVRLDGRWVGKLADNEDVNVPVQPGSHDVLIKLDWGTSPMLTVQVEAGEVARLLCGPGSLPGLVVPHRYLILRR